MKLSNALIALIFLFSCQTPTEQPAEFSFDQLQKKSEAPVALASTRIDLVNKGVGPISEVELASVVDKALVENGEDLYAQKCTACHKIGERFIGPPPNGILNRRTPEWVMNMILNPEGMLKSDALAKDLFMEFNGAPMANQGLTQQEARAILEYFRTLN